MSIGRHSAGLDPQLASHPDGPRAGAPPADASPADAVLAWAAARDAALRGLVHALSNRVGTVAAVGAMLDGAPPAASVGTAARVLAGEGERLEALLAHLRLATADPFGADARPEPVHVPELVGEVAALARAAGWEVAVDVDGDVPPALVPRVALAHAVLVLAHAAGAAAGGCAAVACAGDGGRAVVRVTGPGDAGPDAHQARRAGAWLVGDAPVDDGGALRLPTLGRR